MAKASTYRPKSSYVSKDPGKRQRQLQNLKNHHKTKPIATKVVKSKKSPDKFPHDPIGFIETHFYVVEGRKPMVLLDWQKAILTELFLGKVKPNLAVIGQPKKTGKSTLAAAVALWFLTNKPISEVYLLASSAGQSQLVCFDKLVKAIRMNPVLRDLCKVRVDRVEYQDSIAQILAPNQAVAGINPSLIVAEELWSWTTNEHRRAWDELTNVPTRPDNLNLVTSYAGYLEDEESILWTLYKAGIDQAEGREKKDSRFYFRWFGRELYDKVPWVKPTYLEQQKRRLRENAYLRLHENKWASGEENFVDAAVLDAITNTDFKKSQPFKGPVCVGVDIGLKHDTSAIVVVGQADAETLVTVDHRCFVPERPRTLDLEKTVEAVMLAFHKKYDLRLVYYDPFQFARSARTLEKAGLPMVEYPQTLSNTVAMSEALSGILNNQTIMFYESPELRQHLLNARARDSQRGWRLVKRRQSQKIDLSIALAMAVKAAQEQFLLRKECLFYV